ncbi:MAG: transporter substrate-binding domain-containing protein [Gammaproteobacteria bacterium]|nr:transporter substrate-binding domain-containing protein [Gammaproteobacteria bacterium]
MFKSEYKFRIYHILIELKHGDTAFRMNLLSKSIVILVTLLSLFFSNGVIAINVQSSLHASQTSEITSSQFNLTDEEKNWLIDHPEITVGVMNAWAPFNFVDKYGVPSGIGADYIALLNKRLGGVLKLKSGTWENIYNGVKEKRLDALMDITLRPEREIYFNFTAPYLSVPHVIVARKNDSFLNNEDDLIGKTVALERGFGNVNFFRKNYPQVQILEYTDTKLALDAVSRGEADAYAGNRSVALYLIGQEVMTNLKVHGRLRKKGSILSIGVRKDWKILAKILDRALTDISQDEIRRIQSRWVGDVKNYKQIFLTDREQAWINNHPTVRIAFDGNYPPYSYKNEQGEFSGVVVDIAHELAVRLGLQLEIYPHGQWQQLYQAGKNRDVDIIATLVKRPEREQWFEFTRPHTLLRQYVVTRKEKLEALNQKSSLAGRTIAVIEGYSMTDILLKEIKNITPYYVMDLREAIEAVSVGKADAVIADIGIAQHIIAMSGLSNLGFATLYTKEKSRQRFGVRKDWPELALILDKALQSLSYKELINIYSRWTVPKAETAISDLFDRPITLTMEEKVWLDKHPVIRLASDYNWPPFETINERGEFNGIAADYMKLIEQRIGIKFMRSPKKPWSEIMEMVSNRELDLFSCAMETEQRMSYAMFTKPYISNPMIIVTRDDVDYVDGIQGLQDKKIAIEQGYASSELLSKKHPELLLQAYNDSLSAMLAVSKGEAFAYVGNIATMSHVARVQGITNIKISGQIPYQFELALGARSDWPELVTILQKALDSISLKEKNAILQKWISIDLEKPYDYSLLWKAVVITVVILLVFLYWNLTLKKKVHERTSQLRHQANFDALTDLPNRVLIIDRLNQLLNEAERNNTQVAVLFLDLDDFKKINDSLGHDVGDQLLIETADRLQAVVRTGDSVGRLGGDEFIILLGGLKDLSDTGLVAENVHNSFKKAFKINNRELILTTSVGIAHYPNDGDNPSLLLRNADSAMYHSKQLGRNTYSFFTDAMNQKVARRLLIDEHMHGALERGEFEVYYQPKVNIENRHITGFEALLRWHNQALGQISPDEFIPIAEHNSLIIPIGQFVLERALDITARWQKEHGQIFSMAVNLSPLQFRDPGLLACIETALQQSGLTKESLELEITEGVLMSGHGYIEDTLHGIKELGINIAMDDFGTGYSSLSYLRNYPFNVLKIDRSFINDITFEQADRELVNAAIAMAHGLQIKVVAEGVETEEQLAYLKNMGCDYGQGYLFGKPMSAQAMSKILQSENK